MLLVIFWLLEACITPAFTAKSMTNGTYWGCQNYTGMGFTSLKPYYNFSFDLAKDINAGHFRPPFDILKSGVEFILIPNSAPMDHEGALKVNELSREYIDNNAVNQVKHEHLSNHKFF